MTIEVCKEECDKCLQVKQVIEIQHDINWVWLCKVCLLDLLEVLK